MITIPQAHAIRRALQPYYTDPENGEPSAPDYWGIRSDIMRENLSLREAALHGYDWYQGAQHIAHIGRIHTFGKHQLDAWLLEQERNVEKTR